MLMFKCGECGHVFEAGEERVWTETSGETLYGCPMCSGGFQESFPCKICGSHDKDVNDHFCMKCAVNVKNRMEAFLDSEFTKAERELLNEIYDGEEL